MSKVLVIGLDGATLDLIEPWALSGKLPVFADLMARGAYGHLRSVMPVLSSAAWTSFMTGKNPGKHSIYDFVRREPDGYRLRVMRRDHLRSDSLWKILSRQDKQVGVMNVPMTYPPEEVNGFIVTGLGTPNFKPFTYPEELGKELLKRGYQVNKRTSYKPGQEAPYLAEIHQIADRQLNAALWLMQSQPWDFFMNVFFDTDQMAHFFWRYMDANHPAHNAEAAKLYRDAILEFYQMMDASIGALMEAAGADANVFVISDHGAGPFYRDVFLNEWLRQENFLAIQDASQVEAAHLEGRKRFFARLGLTRDNVSVQLRRRGLERVERWIKDLIGDYIEFLPRTQRAEFPQAIDWSKTQAYSFGYQGQIYINLKGREPQGIVNPGDEYEHVCQQITERLLSLVDPLDGKPVVDQVLRNDQVFQGPYSDLGPDLILIMRGLSYNTRQGYEFSSKAGKIFSDPVTNESGSHRPDGILFAAGPDIASTGRQPDGARLIDIAPTALHLLHCSLPEGLDGRVLENWITATHQQKTESQNPDDPAQGSSEQTVDDEEEAEMIARLKSLGYLE